jgi:hypothetical protein
MNEGNPSLQFASNPLEEPLGFHERTNGYISFSSTKMRTMIISLLFISFFLSFFLGLCVAMHYQ